MKRNHVLAAGLVSTFTVLTLAFQNCNSLQGRSRAGSSATGESAAAQSGATSENETNASGLNTSASVQSFLDPGCLTNNQYDACVFLKSPVSARGSAFEPSQLSWQQDMSAYQTYGVTLTGLDNSGFLQNASFSIRSSYNFQGPAYATGLSQSSTDPNHSDPDRFYRISRTSAGNWKHRYGNDTNHAALHVHTYYWLNRTIEQMEQRTGTFFAKNRHLQVDVYRARPEEQYVNSNAFFTPGALVAGYTVNSIVTDPGTKDRPGTSQQLYREMALDADIMVHELGHANLYYAMGEVIHQSRNCPDVRGCLGALHEGQADFQAALIFPDNPATGQTLANSMNGITGSVPRNVATNTNLSAQQAYSASPLAPGEFHNMGAVYAAAWWSIYTRPASNRQEVERLFTEHLRTISTSDNFATVLEKIVTVDRQLLNGQYGAAFREEFNRRGMLGGSTSTTTPSTNTQNQTQPSGSSTCTEAEYLSRYPDVAVNGVNPFLHYARFGRSEGRCRITGPCSRPLNEGEYLELYSDVAVTGANPFLHYARFGRNEGRCQITGPCSQSVTGAEYLEIYPDVDQSRIPPKNHYASFGQAEGRCPLLPIWFDADQYLNTNADLGNALGNDRQRAAEHFCTYVVRGQEQRALRVEPFRVDLPPVYSFNANAYLRVNPDVAAAGSNPQDHLCTFGISEGRLLK